MALKTLTDMHDETLTLAAEMAACATTDDILAMYDRHYPKGSVSHDLIQRSPHAAYFGRASLLLAEMIRIIEWQRETLACQSSQIMDLADALADAKAARSA